MRAAGIQLSESLVRELRSLGERCGTGFPTPL
jgi:hypothetical protein